MKRGHHWGIGWLKQGAYASVCAGLLCALLLAGMASASNDLKATPQPDRHWENYYGVTILPSGRVVVTGDKGVVMASDDGGRTWARQILKKGLKYYDLYSVAFAPDGSRGWVVGDAGVIFQSEDQGASWTERTAPSGLNAALLKIAVADAQRFCASGEHGVLLCTTDGGTTWNLQRFRDIAFFDLLYTDPKNVWAVGEFATILHSGDGGKTWQVRNGGELSKGDPLFALSFDGHQGLAVGLIGSSMQTNDGGQTWQPHELSIGHKSLYAVSSIPAQAGQYYAAGEEGLSILINNGEVMSVPSGVADAIASAAFSSRLAFAVGLSGTLIRSDDGGRHWRSLVRKPTLLTQAQ
jgi:photosystem II stability/assembly factor-like uncharacterized protein